MSRRLAAMQKAKTAKQKKIAIVGAVLLLGVLAFSVPQTLKLLNKSDAAAAPPPATTSAVPPAAPAPGAPAALAPAAPSAPAGELASVDLAPVPGDGQLASFERFSTKDPFAQQVVAVAPSAPAAAKRGEAKPAAKKEAVKPKPPKVEAPGAAESPESHESPEAPSKAPVVKPTSAVISVNGISETVAPGADFPAELKVFTLVSLAPGKAEIAIAGGTLAGGAETVTLVKGEKLTLMNTADGTRYELVLVSLA